MDYYELTTQLLQIYDIMQTLETCCIYLKENEETAEQNTLKTVETSFQEGVLAVCAGVKALGVHLPDTLETTVNTEDFISWQKQFWECTMNGVYPKILQQTLYNPNMLKQVTAEHIEKFRQFLQIISVNPKIESILLIASSECCCTSAPQLSFDMCMDAIFLSPDILCGLLEHLTRYIFSADVLSQQREFVGCPICGGKGEAFHNAFSWKMSDFNDKHLPFKLWMKCPDCGNLYSRYYAECYLQCDAGLKFLKPEPNTECICSQTNTSILRSWCDILYHTQKYTNGKELLEVGIGTGDMIATALELGYHVDCVEIIEEAAQSMANVLQHPIICCDFLCFPEEKQYDVISLGDVIEHLSDPQKGLEKVYRLLKADGVAWISTPNYMSGFNRLNGMRTAMWNEPFHVTYFCQDGLKNLLNEIGFEVLDYRISKHYNGSMELMVRKRCSETEK